MKSGADSVSLTLGRCMTHSEKIARLISELSAKRVKERTIAPPIFRLLWALGIEIPPPLFIHFFPFAVWVYLFVAPVMGVLYWMVGLANSPSWAVIFGALAGLIVAFPTALSFYWKGKTLNLPAWEDYGTQN